MTKTVLQIRLGVEQKEKLSLRAKESGMTVTEYVLDRCLGVVAKDIEEAISKREKLGSKLGRIQDEIAKETREEAVVRLPTHDTGSNGDESDSPPLEASFGPEEKEDSVEEPPAPVPERPKRKGPIVVCPRCVRVNGGVSVPGCPFCEESR